MPAISQLTVWSFTVRLTHWLIALAVITNFVNETGYRHRMIGYACLVLIGIRVLHGLSTKQTSSHFRLPRIREIYQHMIEILNKTIKDQKGHNPLGQLAVYLMWLLVILLGFSGWLSRTDVFWGGDGPVVVHVFLAYLLMVFVFLHISAVLLMSKLQKKNLIKPMIVITKKPLETAKKTKLY